MIVHQTVVQAEKTPWQQTHPSVPMLAALALQNELQILDQFGLQDGQEIRFWPNARASRAVFKFRGQQVRP